jgi:hypothetical protein
VRGAPEISFAFQQARFAPHLKTTACNLVIFAPTLLGTKGTMARVSQAATESFEERIAALATMAGDRWRLNQKP